MPESESVRDLEDLARHETWLRPMVRALVGDDAANDVLQLTWLQAWRHRPPRPVVRGWLARVATRFALSHRRAERRRQRHEAGLPQREPEPSTAATVERLSVQRAVSAAVSELPEPYRTAVLLRHYHGLGVDEVARRTGTTPANVRQRTRRGLAAMRARLDRDLGGEWRAQPAVLALLGVDLAPSPFQSLPVLLLMNKLRLALILLVSAGLGGAVLLWHESAATTLPQRPHTDVEVAAAPATAPATPPAEHAAPLARTEVAAAVVPPAPRLQGEVRDLEGRAVGQVEIGIAEFASGRWRGLARSAADGSFLVDGTWPLEPLRVAPPWFAVAASRTGPEAPTSKALLVVVPARELVVAVRDPDGEPILGSSAFAREYGLVDYPGVLDDTLKVDAPEPRLDANGEHHWTQLPLSRTFVTVGKPGYLSVTVPITVDTPSPLEVTLRPIRGGQRVVTGVVTDRRGALLPRAVVGLGDRRTRTDANGVYTLRLEAGAAVGDDAALYAVAPGWYPTTVDRFGARLRADDRSPLTVDLQLDQASVAIRGRVVDHAGRPQAGVFVYPWQLPNLTSSQTAEDLAAPVGRTPLSLTGNAVRAFARTVDDGSFELAGLAPRSYQLRVYQRDSGWAWTSAPIRGGTDDAVIELPADVCGPVSGVVRTRDGLPAAGVTVGTYLDVHANGGGVAAVGLSATTVTDAEGRFALASVPRYGASLSFRGQHWVEGRRSLEPGDVDVSITLARRCHVRVCMVDPVWASATIRFVDAAGNTIPIHQERANLQMTSPSHELHDGKTQVLSVSEAAVALIVTTAGDAPRTQRFEIDLRAGQVETLTL